MLDALKSWPIVVLGSLVVVIVVVWGAIEDHIEGKRKEQGYSLCENTIRDDLRPGYEPAIDVFFYKSNSSGDFFYDALADDGDGDWGCKVSWVDGEANVTTSASTYRSVDQRQNSSVQP